MATVATRSLDEDLTDPQFVQDPYPVYARLRAEDPVHWCEPWQQWIVTRFDAVRAITLDPARFSSAGWEESYLHHLGPDLRARLPHLERHYATNVLSNTDPPAHSRLRRRVAASFTPRVLDAIRPDVERLVDELLGRLDRSGVVDLVGEFAYPLPAIVIAQLFGAPEEGRDQFERWSADIVSFVGSGRPQPERAIQADASLGAFRSYLEPLIERARADPQPDLLSQLVLSDADGPLTDDELVATCVTLLFAGHETTANLIANGLLALLCNPSDLDRLKADTALAAPAVEELLRYDGPVQRLRRRATQDVELEGKHIRAGQLVMAFVGAANRDPDRFDKPDRLNISPRPGGHLAFGHGIHFCVGAALTRLEAPIAWNALLDRFPNIRLTPGTQLRRKPNITFRGLEALPLELR
jgi:cytochrome P450